MSNKFPLAEIWVYRERKITYKNMGKINYENYGKLFHYSLLLGFCTSTEIGIERKRI